MSERIIDAANLVAVTIVDVPLHPAWTITVADHDTEGEK